MPRPRVQCGDNATPSAQQPSNPVHCRSCYTRQIIILSQWARLTGTSLDAGGCRRPGTAIDGRRDAEMRQRPFPEALAGRSRHAPANHLISINSLTNSPYTRNVSDYPGKREGMSILHQITNSSSQISRYYPSRFVGYGNYRLMRSLSIMFRTCPSTGYLNSLLRRLYSFSALPPSIDFIPPMTSQLIPPLRCPSQSPSLFSQEHPPSEFRSSPISSFRPRCL
jgi:hypothetical protein